MTYNATINWLFSQLPMYQRLGKSAYKVDLSNTVLFAKHLKNPETKFKSIHVAGTNGKGSTCHMLASILQEAGYKVGLYTSPHLKDFRERIKINGAVISKQAVIGFVKRNQSFFEANSLSFFEMTVGMAFDVFAKQKVDVAIVEVGLGGRLDSTNIITPEISVITNIGLDHTQFLGNTLAAVAKEKAGIIKDSVPLVVGETQAETKIIFKELARAKKAKISFADKEVKTIYKTELLGAYQAKNVKTVVQSIKEMNTKGFLVSEDAIKTGLLNVVKNTGLLGRWQILSEAPKVVCDTAHNREGLTLTMQQLQNENYGTLHIVFGVVNDKDLEPIMETLPQKATYYLCAPNISRRMDVEQLKAVFDDFGFVSKAYKSVKQAYKKAVYMASKEDVIYIGGSTFVVSELI